MFYTNAIIILIFGLCFGSFVTMCSHRFATNISTRDFLFKRSFCPNCHQQLKIKNLIPIFSWIFQKGKCGFCQQKISIRYPAIEITCALIFLLIFLSLKGVVDAKLIVVLLMSVTLLIMVVTDLENYFIPNLTQITLAILAIIYHLVAPDKNGLFYYFYSSLAFYIAGIILYYGFWIATKRQGIGGDDLKFFAVAGLALGLDKFIIFMILNGLIGSIFGILWTKIFRDRTFPFAPALVVSFLICLLFKINYLEWFGALIYLFEKHITKTAY